MGFIGTLFLIFLVLKLTGLVHWSWWWVAAPLWLPLAAVLVFSILLVSVARIFFVLWHRR